MSGTQRQPRARRDAARALAPLVAVLALLPCGSAPAGEVEADPPAGGGPRVSSDPLAFKDHVLGFKNLVGSFRAESVKFFEFPPVTDVRANLTITEESDWRLGNIQGEFCGGRAIANVDIFFKVAKVADRARAAAGERKPGRKPGRGRRTLPRLVPPKPGKTLRFLDFESKYVGAKLEEFTRHVEYPVTPGTVNAHLELTMTSEGLKGLEGSAEAHLRNGNLGRFPFVVKALSFLTLDFPGLDEAMIEEADALVTLTTRSVRIKHLTMRTRDGAFALTAERLGEVTYDGRIDIYFRPVFESSFLRGLPVVGGVIDRVIEDIKQRGMRVRVTGHYSEPKFQWAAFRFR